MSKNPPLNGIILVSFEYPPRRLSKISDSVKKLSLFLSKKKIKTWVVTFDDWRSDVEKISDYLTINRIPYNVPNNISELAMIMNLKVSYQAAIASIIHSEKIDLIHFFDWMTLPVVISWKDELQQKLVYSTNSTQITRDKTTSPYNSGIQKIEQMGLEAVHLITVNSKNLFQIITSDYKINEKIVHQLNIGNKKSLEELLEKYEEKI
ncbi:MAG: glycosyltransferase family 4 protein [Candidatus Heimdallarchaeota archaeon]